MTFLELCQRVREKCGVSGTGPTAVTGQSGEMLRIVNWVIDADREIQNKWLNWKFLHSEDASVTLASAQADYTAAAADIPSDVNIWDKSSFRIDDEYELSVVEYEDYVPDTSLSATKPWEVVILNNGDLRFIPTPGAAYTVKANYWAVPTELAANTDVSAIPVRYHMIIVYRAMLAYANYEDAPETHEEAMLGYAEMLRQLEMHQLPGENYVHGMSTGGDIVVVPE